MTDTQDKLAKVAATLFIGEHRRHVFLCTGDKCCSSEAGLAAWEVLKAELKSRNLTQLPSRSVTNRTKVTCLRVCTEGPILVVYPEGTYYHGMTADRIPRFVEEHLVGGKPVEEWVFARNPLSPA